MRDALRARIHTLSPRRQEQMDTDGAGEWTEMDKPRDRHKVIRHSHGGSILQH
jgi:hypothetical protein